jgi:hypothetical protein
MFQTCNMKSWHVLNRFQEPIFATIYASGRITGDARHSYSVPDVISMIVAESCSLDLSATSME